MTTAILLAAYNGSRFLGEQLDSLLAQTVRDFVICIHDDGSVDETPAIIAKYAGQYPGRFRIVGGAPTGGAKYNFWYLMEQVEADVYFFCDQDDVWVPDKVQRERDALLSQNGPAAVFSDMTVVDERMREIAPSFIRYTGCDASLTKYTQTLIDNVAAGTTLCFNRALRDALVEARMELASVEMHDGLLLAAADLLGKAKYIDEALVRYRQHDANEMGAVHEKLTEKLFRNLSDVVSGRFFKSKRAFFALSQNAAGELLKLKGISEKDKKVLRIYRRLDALSKGKRIRFLRKNGFKRAHRTVWMYLWI